MTSNTLRDADINAVLHPYTDPATHEEKGPFIITRGEGVRVFDEEGRPYIEGMSGLWCAALGFSEERLVAAATRQMQTLPFYHMFSHKAHAPGITLAETLLGLAPVPMAKVFFANSGSEANDTVVKMVRMMNHALGRPEKRTIIARTGGYHGVTVATASLTGMVANHTGFGLPIPGILHTERADYWRDALPGEDEAAFTARMIQSLEDLILEEGPETIAAFIAEPVMGAGGVVIPPAGYFEGVQALLKRHDILMVADEVICGFGRTGNWWGSQTFGIRPDILTCAKALSSAYLPISAVLISQPIYEALRSATGATGGFRHGYTYSAHPVPAAVALEALAIYRERDIPGHAARVGERLQTRLRALSEHPLVGQARGVGLIGAIQPALDKANRKPFPPTAGIGPAVVAAAQAEGVILRNLADDVVAFSPPLIITEAEVDEMMDRVGRALDRVAETLPKM